MEFKIGDKVVKNIKNNFDSNKIQTGWKGTIVRIISEESVSVDWNELIDGHDCSGKSRPGHGWDIKNLCLELIPEVATPTWKSMKLIDYKKIAKLRDKLRYSYGGKTIEGICGGIGGKIDKNYCYFWQNEQDGNGNFDPQLEYKWSFAYPWEENIEVELLTSKVFTKKRKAYVEISKESGKIFISLKIPSEIEEFFKGISEDKVKTSEAWFQKEKGVEYYAQPKELETKLTDIDEYVYSDFGSGLMRDENINVAILRTVGCSKGVKIHSDGFSSLTNADLQDYVRRLGLYIKRLWETNISSTRIKSVITFEI